MAFCEVKPEYLRWVLGYTHALMKEGKTIEQIVSEVRQELPGNQPFLTNTLLSKVPLFMQTMMTKSLNLQEQYIKDYTELFELRKRFEGPDGYIEVAKFNNNVEIKDEVEAEILNIKSEAEEENYKPILEEFTEEVPDNENFPDAYLKTSFKDRQAAEKEAIATLEIGDGIELEIKTKKYETEQEKGEVREGEKNSGKQNGQRVIQDFGKNFQPKFSNAVPYGLEGKLADHQKTGVNAIVQAVSNNNSFLLADGAGAGKTRILLTSAKVLKEKGKKVIIVTQSKDIIQGSFKSDSATLGMSFIKGKNDSVEIGGVPIVTIDNFSKVLDPSSFDTIILDESHKASGLVSQASKKLRAFDGQVVYASATPFDTESKTLYILPRLLGISEETYLTTIGGKLKKVPRRDEPDLVYDAAKFNSLMNTVHSRFISEGKMLHRRFEFYGNDKLDLNTIGNSDEFGGGYSIEELEDRIRELAREKAKKIFLTSEDIKAGETVESKKRKAYELTANQIKSVPETFKANDDMLAQVERDLADGKQVIVYSVNVKEDGMSYQIINREGEEETVNRPSMLVQMEKKLKDRGINFGVITGKIRNRSTIVDKFQKGDLKMLLINESGTTGINLNDTLGNAPRKLYIAGALPSAIQLEQVKGRVSRINNASPAEVSYVSVNSSAEGRNREKLLAKMAIMNSILTGEQLNNAVEKQNRIEEIKQTVKEGFVNPYIEENTGGASFLVKGSTQEVKDILKKLGARGIYSAPKAFSGWQFPISRKQEIQEFLNTTFNKVSEINNGVERVNEEISSLGNEAPVVTKSEVSPRIQNILGDIVSPSEEMIRKSQDEQNKRC